MWNSFLCFSLRIRVSALACIAYDVSFVVFFLCSTWCCCHHSNCSHCIIIFCELMLTAKPSIRKRCQQHSHLHWSKIIAERYCMHTWWIYFYCSSWHTQRMHKPILVSSRSGKPCTTYHVHQVFKFCGKLMLMAQLLLSTFHIWFTEGMFQFLCVSSTLSSNMCIRWKMHQ